MFILDTNVVSEMRKISSGRADRTFAAWSESARPEEQYLSVVTVMELEQGVLKLERRDPLQAHLLRIWLATRVLPSFDGRVISIDVAVARRWAKLQVPDPKSYRDTLIGATALVHGLTVMTRNVVDFAPMGVDIVDHWTSQTGH